MNVKYRKAAERDIPQLIELWKEFIDFHKIRDSFFTRSEEGPENFGKYILENMQKEEAVVYIAEDSKKIVAHVLCLIQFYPPAFETKQYGLISDLAVTSDYRRKGIGEHLFNLSKDWFESNGIHRIEIVFATTNEVSTSFWTKMGLRPYKSLCYINV